MTDQSSNSTALGYSKTSILKKDIKLEPHFSDEEGQVITSAGAKKSFSRHSSEREGKQSKKTHSTKYRSSTSRTASPTSSYISTVKFRPRAQSALESSGNVIFPRLTSALLTGESHLERSSVRNLSSGRKTRSTSGRHSGGRQYAVLVDSDNKHIAAERKILNRASITSAPSTRSGSSSFSEKSAGSYKVPSSRTSFDSLASSLIEESDTEIGVNDGRLVQNKRQLSAEQLKIDATVDEEPKTDQEMIEKEYSSSRQSSISSNCECSALDSSETSNTSLHSPSASPEPVQHEKDILAKDQKDPSDSGNLAKADSQASEVTKDTTNTNKSPSVMATESEVTQRPSKRKTRSKKPTKAKSPEPASERTHAYPDLHRHMEYDAPYHGFHSLPPPQQQTPYGPYMLPSYPYEPTSPEQVHSYDIAHPYAHPFPNGPIFSPECMRNMTLSEEQPAQQLPSIENGYLHESESPSKKSSIGYDLLASKLTREETLPGSKLTPMYRKFERLNHRVLLHLQSEISELEDELRMLDNWVAESSRHEQRGSEDNSSMRGSEPLYNAELHYRRTELLGRIFVKLGQYSM